MKELYPLENASYHQKIQVRKGQELSGKIIGQDCSSSKLLVKSNFDNLDRDRGKFF